MAEGKLKTAGGYLLVLHTLDELGNSSGQLIMLLRRARAEGDWDLCKELARFLMALDASGETLRRALEEVGLRSLASTMSELSRRLGIENVSNSSATDEGSKAKDYFTR